ncbi:MAG TPA: glycosyltransferase [Chitinophagales bacterium]|nr:glycosyltransferase [Chitinophagales bacterium]
MPNPHKILFLPRWYPSENDLQNGVFIQKHARAAAMENEVMVLYAVSVSKESRIVCSNRGNLKEVILYYPAGNIRLLNFIASLRALFKLWRFTRKSFQPDICHIHVSGRQALLALWLNLKYGIPFIISEHWSGFVTGEYERQSFFKKWLTACVFKKATAVTAVSETLRDAMINRGLGKEIRILPNVVEVLPDGAQQHPAEDVFRYLIVADLRDEIKNISGAIRAFSEVCKAEPSSELVIAGEGKDRDKLERLVIASFQTNSPPVKFLGLKSNEEVLKLIPAAHVIIVNSRIETFSVVTLEAIFSGRPVIATRCGGPERFINEHNGILIGIDNEKELVHAMIQMKRDYRKYNPDAIKNSIPNTYAPESIARLLNSFYNEAAARQS